MRMQTGIHLPKPASIDCAITPPPCLFGPGMVERTSERKETTYEPPMEINDSPRRA